MPLLSAEPWLRLSVAVAPAQRFGESGGGERRCVPLLDGGFTGRLSGTLLPGGADWQEVAADGTTRIEAHYALRADSGGITDVRSSGVRSGPAAVMQALLAGEAVDPTLVYFRTALRFGGTAPEWQAFTRQLFVGVGHRDPDQVRLNIYAVE